MIQVLMRNQTTFLEWAVIVRMRPPKSSKIENIHETYPQNEHLITPCTSVTKAPKVPFLIIILH